MLLIPQLHVKMEIDFKFKYMRYVLSEFPIISRSAVNWTIVRTVVLQFMRYHIECIWIGLWSMMTLISNICLINERSTTGDVFSRTNVKCSCTYALPLWCCCVQCVRRSMICRASRHAVMLSYSTTIPLHSRHLKQVHPSTDKSMLDTKSFIQLPVAFRGKQVEAKIYDLRRVSFYISFINS